MPDPDVDGLYREFRRRLERRQIAFLLIIVPGALAFGLLPMETTKPFLVPFGLLLAALSVLDWLTWRCPACGTALSKRVVPWKCPECGVDFRKRR